MYEDNFNDTDEDGKKRRNEKLSLKELKDNVNDWFRYFKRNNDEFKENMTFVYKTTLTDDTQTNLKSLGKPLIEFNGLPAMVSREVSQFVMNAPGFEVSLADGMMYDQIPKEVLAMKDAVEGNIRYAFCNENNISLANYTYTESLVGGYSAWEMKEDYVNEETLEKELYTVKTIHPTMTGWDPAAKEIHKGDGDRAFELIPMKKLAYEKMYGKHTKNKSFTPKGSLGDVNWSYRNSNEEFVLICYYYQRVVKKIKKIQFSNGDLVESTKIQEYLDSFDEDDEPIETGNFRMCEKETIYRYVFSECGILEYEPTKLPMLPYIYVDGNSQMMGDVSGQYYQITKSYIKDAKGFQAMKNALGQTLVYDAECLVQSPFIAAWESIKNLPLDYQKNWLQPQKKSLLVYESFLKGPDGQQAPPPFQVQKQETPQFVTQAFFNMDTMIGVVMGSNQSQLMEQGPHISGKAQDKALIMSSMTAQPYVNSYRFAMQRAADFRLKWMERNMINARIMPIVDNQGKSDMIPINSPQDAMGNPINGNINLNFKSNHFKITVKPGNNIDAQKDLALEAVRENCKSIPGMASFIEEEGLTYVLDNMDGRNIEYLREKAPEYQEQLKQRKMAAAQNAPMDPVKGQIKIAQMTLQQKEMAEQRKYDVDMANTTIKKQSVDIDAITAMAEISNDDTQNAIKQEQIDAENARTVILEAADIHTKNHQIRMDHVEDRREQERHEMEKERHKKELEMMDKEKVNESKEKSS